MKAVKISLNSIDKVKSFCNDIAKFDAEFDLVSGRYVIDAKSQSQSSLTSMQRAVLMRLWQHSSHTLPSKFFKINYIITIF